MTVTTILTPQKRPRSAPGLEVQTRALAGLVALLLASSPLASNEPSAAQADPYLPADTTPFYMRGFPVLNAFTGAHEDYATPRDTADQLNHIDSLLPSVIVGLGWRVAVRQIHTSHLRRRVG